MSLLKCLCEKMNITIRPIVKEDNRDMAVLIKSIFLEFNLPKKGTAYSNPTTNNLYALFQTEKSAYWVVPVGKGSNR